MDPSNLPPLNPAWRQCLRDTQDLLQAGQHQEAVSALTELPGVAAMRPELLVGALCLGGFDLAEIVVGHAHPEYPAEQCAAAAIEALCDFVEADRLHGREGHAPVAEWLVANFELPCRPETLLEGLRVRVLIERGSGEDLTQAIQQSIGLQDWALAVQGIERLKLESGSQLPRPLHGVAATCLHHLGRYEEANRWLDEGLGEQAQLIATLPVPDEAELIARWGGRTEPVVSIICTTYNHERFVESALRGFLGQDSPYPFEVLIHDDASTDGTQALIRQWRERYPKLIHPVLQTRNQLSQGVRPWELMLARARGDYVAFCEGDDFWIHPGKLSLQVGYLMTHPDVTCSAHNHYHFRELAVSVLPGQPGRNNVLVPAPQLMAVQKMLWAPTLVFRRTFSSLPPERDLAAFGDQFLISWLGTFGKAACFDSFFGAVRRENEFSTWNPLPEEEKERRRVQTWAAIERLQRRLGNHEAADHLGRCIARSPLDATIKAGILARAAEFEAVPEAG